MINGHVTHAEKDGVHVFRYYGRAEYWVAPALQHYMDEVVEAGSRGVVFDLTQAERLDSTNLGLLARMANRVRHAGGPKCIIVSTREDINSVLWSMGFDRIFDLVTEPPDFSGRTGSGPAERNVPLAQASAAELKQAMLEAHRALAGMSSRGEVEFRDVVACLERDPYGAAH